MKYTRELVRSKAQAVFPGRDVKTVMAELDAYGTEPTEPERERVQMAILKLSEDQKTDNPGPYVDAAKKDYRDVLAWAEYPSQMNGGAIARTDPEGAQRNAEADERQYKAWLNMDSDKPDKS